MSPQFPSIQSFFSATKPNTNVPKHATKDASRSSGDGFTNAEVQAVLQPTVDKNWLPGQEYEELDIDALTPGPGCVMFQGRVVNFFDQATPSKKPRAAKGCVKVIVKDDTGPITVRLWYANLEYELRLGQLVTVWTPHISNGEQGNLASNQAPLFTSIFPERDRSCHLLIHQNSDNGEQCKKPIGYRKSQPLNGLMTLRNFVDGGYDVAEAKLLVCVKSIGAKKKVTPKNGKSPPCDCLSIQVFDSTQSAATLTFWGAMTASASSWRPSHTVLLITRPGWRIERSTYISLTSNTLVDVDPAMPDTLWLRSFAARLTRREDINPPFPTEEKFNVAVAQNSLLQILFTFADLDSFARAAPTENFFGWISVLLTDLSLSLLHRRNMLFCETHCGVPMFGNTLTASCKQCSTLVTLRINPKCLGPVIDETGSSQAGKLYLSADAWQQLLGKTRQELCAMSVDDLRILEQRMLFTRVNMGVAWYAEEVDVGVGRLWVWETRA